MKLAGKNFTNIPLIALVAANIVPLYGVFFAGWDAFAIVLLYWSENLIIGFYNIIKVSIAKVEHPNENIGKLFVIPFFILHYGGFCAGHGFFILALFGKGVDFFDNVMKAHFDKGFLVFLFLLVAVIRRLLSIITPTQLFCIASLTVSHGISFVHNFLIRDERSKTTVKQLMSSPYSRIMVMHIAIIGGAFLMAATKTPAAILFVLVILKTAIDVKLHLREHTKRKLIKEYEESHK